MFRLLIVSVVVLVFFEPLGIIVAVYILGTGLVAVFLIGGCSGAEHVALAVEVGADFVGFGFDALGAGGECALVIEFGVLKQKIQELINVGNVVLDHFFAREPGHMNPQLISNQLNELIQLFTIIEHMRFLNLYKLD